jgi:succinoglycan biosynthesis transport protein ExoP
MDKTMRSSEQVQLASGLPALGIVPVALGAASRRRKLYGSVPATQQLNEAEKIETVTFVRPKSQMSEAYRALGTSILLSGDGEPPRLLMVTSALPEEGKTTTSINTAIVLSQQGGKVLLIDADLRRPSVHKAFDVQSEVGLGAVIAGKAKAEDVTLPHPEIPNLFIMPAGSSVDNPAEMLGSEKMRELLVKLREQYDYIVVDTPPVLTITDAVRLSPRADAVLLVIRSGQTTKEALCRARDLLHQVNANVLGVVVNAVNLDSPEYYSYYSKYGNRYYYEETISKN